MCGLILVISKKKKHTGQRVYDLFNRQRTRGVQGFGYLAINGGKITGVHRSRTEAEIKALLMKDKSDTIMFHHRFPTSTKNVIGATHPIFVSHDELEFDYYIAHNGVISNAHALKREHDEMGYKYTTEFFEKTYANFPHTGKQELITSTISVFNDSESLAIELARFIEKKSTCVSTAGSAAFWGVSVRKGTNEVVDVFFGKNYGRDLKFFENAKWYVVSSETGEDIEDMKLWKFPYDGSADMQSIDLIMDDGKPAPTVTPPSTNVYTQTEHRMGFRSEHLFDDDTNFVAQQSTVVRSYQNLKNCYYTQKERDETGIPPSEFFATFINQEKLYVPNMYSGDPIGRVRFSDAPKTYYDLPEKEQERLEKLCEDYARKQVAFEKIEDAVASGFFDSDEYKRQQEFIEAEMQAIEESISMLGIDQEIVDECLDMSYELISYTEQGSVPTPYGLLV